MRNRALHIKLARSHYLLSTQARLDLKGIQNEEACNSTIAVFRDLLIIWNIPELELAPHCPDVYVVRGIRNKQQNRSRFVAEDEGVRPAFVIEVVSPLGQFSAD